MMNSDATNAQLLLANMLRDAENHRKHAELVREAEAYGERELKRSAVQRIIARLHTQKPSETGEARRVHAV